MRKPLSSYNKVFYIVIVWLRCMHRRFQWLFSGRRFAKTRIMERFPYRVYKHQSVLVRKLGDVDLQLQYNKVTNIQLALKHINGIIIHPGETFSYCYLVGKMSRRKGYLDGMLLSNGEATAGPGGGVCQIANLIHWLCLHSPLTVTEHHHHGFDPFPDSGRVVPFGCGASIFYNYVDYQFRNDTPHTFQLLFWMDSKCLNGDLRVDEDLPYKYHILELNHYYVKMQDCFYRANEIWRKKIKKIGSGDLLQNECIKRNFSLLKYTPNEYVDYEDLPENLWFKG